MFEVKSGKARCSQCRARFNLKKSGVVLMGIGPLCDTCFDKLLSLSSARREAITKKPATDKE